MKILLYIQIFFLLLSCNNASSPKIINSKQQIEIFQNKYVSSPDTSLQLGNNRLLFIKQEEDKGDLMGDIHKLIILEKIGNDWGVIKDTIISKGYHNKMSSFEIVTIDNKEYLYYEDYQEGGSSGNSDLEFTLFDIYNNAKYFIHYSCNPDRSRMVNDFKRSRNIISHNNIKSYLDEKIKNSNRIYRPDNEDILVNRFVIENEKSLIEMDKLYSLAKPIKFTKISTKEEIFDVNNKDSSKDSKSSLEKIQNDDFILISRFKGPVLGYNKSTKEYFCVWAPESIYNWINQMEFDLAGNLVLYDRDDNKPIYLINLYNSTYVKVK